MNRFIAWIAGHRRFLIALLALPIMGGVAAALIMPVTLFPTVTFPRLRIELDAGDRPAQQMLLAVTRPIEQAVRRVPGVTDVRATTSRGTAELSVSFRWGTDMVAAELQADAEVNELLPSLPAGTTATVRRMEPTVFPVIAFSLTSASLSPVQLRDIARFQLRPLLSSIEGVSEIGVVGGREEEYQIVADPARLIAHGLAFDDLVTAVSNSSLIQAVGRIQDHYKLYLVISDNAVSSLDALRHVALKRAPSGTVTVGDVADVVDSTVPQWIRVEAGGADAVLINVFQQRDGNSVQIADEVKQRLAEAAKTLPAGVKVANWYDQSQLILASAGSVRDAILIGIVLAALVLWLFLRDIKITVIAIIVVPAALAATILLLRALGLSFNIMTLGGMAAAIGLIIDDAIVMVEHIVRRRQEAAADAAVSSFNPLLAAREFTRPLAGSSAATLVIFVPLAFLSGVTGAFFQALSLTMASGLFFSFLITWLAVPLAVEHLLTGPVGSHDHPVGAATRQIDQAYARIASWLFARPWVAVISLVPLILIGVASYSFLGSGFMPSIDEGGFVIDYRSAPGTALSETDRLARQVDRILRETPDVDTWSRRTGEEMGGNLSEPNRGDFFIRLKSSSRRPAEEVMAELRARIAGEVPGLDIEMAQLMEDLIGDLTAVPEPIEVKIFGDDQSQTVPVARKVAAAIAKIGGIVDIKDGVNPAGDSLDFRIDRDLAAAEGMDPSTITAQVAPMLDGTVVGQVPTASKLVGIRVIAPVSARKTERDLAGLMIRAPDEHLFPLSRVARIVPVSGEPEIGEENLQGMVAVTARIEGRDMGSAAREVKALIESQKLVPPPLRYELGGLYRQQQIAFAGLMRVFAAASAMVFVLLLLLYESFRKAAIILLMPMLAVAAVMTGLKITGIELNITAMMGMTMVIGIVTEVAIFYFSEFEELHAIEDLPSRLVQAGRNRFRPIAMTTIAAILTLMPLALGLGEGAAMQQPLAIAIISGLFVQIPLVLLVMPALFLLLRKARS